MNYTITRHLLKAKQVKSSHAAIRFKKKRQWYILTWGEFYDSVEAVAAGLRSLGVEPTEKVAVWANTRPEWAFSDLAILSIGAVTVPIYQSSRSEEVAYILKDSETKILLLENRDHVEKWSQIAHKCPQVKAVVCMDSYSDLPDTIFGWDEFLEEGQDLLDKQSDFLRPSIERNNLSDIATIIYTSGTTGMPKGVVLTHEQIMSEVSDLFSVFDVGPTDTSLTFLPYAHVMGRVELWGSIYAGFTLAFAESIERIRANLQQVEPTLLIGVPRIFEKLYAAVVTQVEASHLKHRIFKWALNVGSQISQHKLHKRSIPLALLAQHRLAKTVVFNSLKEKLGGKLRFAISGGAPLSKEIAEFFHAADLLILEGYGLTETTAAVCINTPYNYCFGTVGKPLGDVEIQLAEDGEILVKSKKVMKEYFKDEEATASAMQDDFFATGDIGEFTDQGYLKITDRKKDLIKTAGGKYVAPQKLENLLKLNPMISNVLIHGDKRKYIIALVTLSEDDIIRYAKENEISFQDFASLTQNQKIKELIRQEIANTNAKLASFETIKNFAILPRDFSIEEGELTPSLKVRRKICDEKYRDLIDSLY